VAEVIIPFQPRSQQREIHDNLKRFNVLVCHRRFGKTVLCVNELIRAAIECKLERPRVYYLAPLYRQAKQVAWDYCKHYSLPILDAAYKKPFDHIYDSELKIEFPNGARLQLFGADNPDALRGVYADMVVLDEPAQMPPRLWTEVIRPALTDRKGRGIFIGTPMGRNAFCDIYEGALNGWKNADGDMEVDPDWYAAMYRASDTDIIEDAELKAARRQMSQEQYEQEFECSFQAAISGAYYGRLMAEAERDERITDVPYKPGIAVETWWDLGIADATAIVFVQRIGRGVIHVIDYYEAAGVGLQHYASVLQQRAQEKDWVYSQHVMPHDAGQREKSSGKKLYEHMADLGFHATVREREQNVQHGIERVRMAIPMMYFDRKKCDRLIEALKQYRQEWDEKRQAFNPAPYHDWTSHCADAVRIGLMNEPSSKAGPIVFPPGHVSHGVI